MTATRRTSRHVARSGEGPQRTCVVTRTQTHPDDLIRFVTSPAGEVVPDLANRLPGRGVWVGCRKQLIVDALKRKAFARGFKAQVTADDALPDRIDELLRQRALQALSMANKAGLVLTGNSKVSAALETGDIGGLVQAGDAAEGGRERLSRKFRAIAGEIEAEGSTFEEFTLDELSLALGRPNVVHAALRQGSATSFFVQAARRLRRYKSHAPIESSDSKPEECSAVTAR